MRSSTLLSLLALLAPLGACPSASTPVAPPPEPAPAPVEVEPPPAPTPPPPCLDLGDEPYAVAPMLERVGLVAQGRALYFCRREDAGNACYTLDLDSGALAAAELPSDFDAAWAKPPVPAPLRVSEDRRSAEVCPEGGRCKALRLPVRSATITDASVSADGRHAALTMVAHEQHTIQLYALPSGRALKRITVPSEPFPCASAHFVANTLLVMQDICAGPAGYAWLADPKTAKRIAWVGGTSKFGAWSLHEQPVDGDLWAFREESGKEIVVQSVADGHIARRVDLVATLPTSEDGQLLADPDVGAMLRDEATGELVVVHDGPAQGRVVRVDPRAGAIVKVITAPRCAR